MLEGYRAVVARELGGPANYALADMPGSAPAAGQVKLRVAAAGVSYVDVLIASGGYQVRPATPFVPGTECAGSILAIGEGVEGLEIGQRVAAGCGLGGAFAEEAVVPAGSVIPIPDAIGFAAASGSYVSCQTAYHALVQRGRLQAGETLLVLGASGGVGTAAVEVALALGARVIASASTAKKRTAALALGAAHAIDSTAVDWRDQVKALTAGRGPDVVIDPVGGEETERAFRALAWNGRLLVIGFPGGGVPAIRTNLPLLKGASLIGVDIRQFREREPVLAGANLEALNDLVRTGRIAPSTEHCFPLERFAEAMTLATDRDRIGRIAIVTGGSR